MPATAIIIAMSGQLINISRYFERQLLGRLAERLNFIQVVIGPRQVGKTTAVTRIFENWNGPKKIISADLPAPPDAAWLTAAWQDAASLGDDVLFIVDEVHKVPGWNEIIKSLFDQIRSKRKMKVVLLGSASLSIQRGLGESLAGRYELIKANHWSYGECKRGFGIDFESFLKFGGYPAALELRGDPDRWRSYVRDSIVEPILGRDLLSNSRVNRPALFRQAFDLTMQYPAQVVSYNKLLGQLQDRGNTDTIKHYLSLLEGGFLLKQVYKYSRGALSVKTSSPKIIPLDLALVSAMSNFKAGDSAWRGHLVEAAFGAYLSRKPGELFYWADERHEVDFVHEIDGALTAYEIKSGRERDGKGLVAFTKKYPEAKVRLVDTTEIQALLEAEAGE